MTNTSSNNAWVDHITFTFEALDDATTYSGYCTSLTEITLTTTNNMAGWRSFYDASQAYEVDENTTIYVVRAKSETVDKVVLTDAGTNAIPAATPVILKTTASDYQMTLTKVSTAAALGNNLLAVTNGTDNVEGYRLGYNATDGVAFFHYTPATAPEAGIVYIPVDGVYVSDEGRGLTISFEDNDPSGIMNVNVNHDDNYYDLRGRRVQKPGKGLYIVNGKKVMVK